jgi:hypothetical protein
VEKFIIILFTIKRIILDIIFVLNKNIFSNIFHIVLILRKRSLTKRIIKEFNSKKILNGPYKSVNIEYKNWRCDTHLPKLLGIYEKEVQKEIILLSKKFKLKYLVNFGASDGYHIISLIKKKYFQYGYAFEIDKIAKNNLISNVYNNKLKRKIKVFNNANFIDVFNNLNSHQLKKTLFLVDIEGGEYSIFNIKDLKKLKSSFFIIEIHKTLENNCKTYESYLKKYFKIKIIDQSERNPHEIKKLKNFDDNDKFIMMSETRPYEMKWFLLYPKSINL